MVAVCHCSINREIPRFEYDICLHRFARNSFVADKSALNLIVPFFNWTRLTFGCYNTACLPVWLKCHQYYIETCQIVQIEREREEKRISILTRVRFLVLYTRLPYYTEEPPEIAFTLQLVSVSPWRLLFAFHPPSNLTESKLRGGIASLYYIQTCDGPDHLFFPLSE